MRCFKCDKTYDDNLLECPFCNEQIDTESDDLFEEHIELLEDMEEKLSDTKEFIPINIKRRDDGEASLDETIAINLQHNDSLIDEINKQIDEMNEEATISEEKEVDQVEQVEELNNKRTFSTILTVLFVLLVAVISCIVLFAKDNTKRSEPVLSFEERLEEAIDIYYNGGDIEDLVTLLNEVKRNSDKVEVIQNTIKITCDEWIIKYRDETAKSKKDFEDITYNYRELIDGLYRYALVKNKDIYIRALTEIDYDELVKKIEDIYEQSRDFYDALDLYNEKDYNRSYYMFKKILEDNSYYDNAISYIDKIYENIIELLEKDINKLTGDIDLLTDKEKLDIYIVVEETIIEYDNIYSVDLNENSKYQELLSIYSNKVSEYTEIVYNK